MHETSVENILSHGAKINLGFDFFPSNRISEERFWRNYFYRVSLIKQSTQLTSLAAAGNEEVNLFPFPSWSFSGVSIRISGQPLPVGSLTAVC